MRTVCDFGNLALNSAKPDDPFRRPDFTSIAKIRPSKAVTKSDRAAKSLLKTASGHTTYTEFSRLSLGYAFTRPLPARLAFIADSWDIQPRLGTFTMDSTIELTNNAAVTYTTPFKLSSGSKIGVDVGLMRSFIFGLGLRGFVAYDQAFSTKSIEKTTFRSIRAGIDLKHPLTKFQKTNLTGLLFAMMDRSTMSQPASAGQYSSEESATPPISTLTYTLPFTGAGLGISW